MDRRRVLFVCTHNSARSQMAEGMLRAWADGAFEAYSAGTEPTTVRPEAVAVMAEIGIDISSQRAKPLGEFRGQEFHWLISVCERAREKCSSVPGVQHPAHWHIDDPAEASGSGEERLAAFRSVRNDLGNRLHMFILAAGRPDVALPAAVRLGS